MFDFFSSPLCANIIAIAALLIGIYNWNESRSRLDGKLKDDLNIVLSRDLYIRNVSNALDVPFLFLSDLKAVNASGHDIAFFDLRAFNPETNVNYGLITRKTLPPEIKEAAVQVEMESRMVNQDIPERSFGVFSARSFTHFDLLIYPHPGQQFEKEVVVSFKVSKRTLFRKAPFAIERKKYESFGRCYSIDGWESALRSRLYGEKDISGEHQSS